MVTITFRSGGDGVQDSGGATWSNQNSAASASFAIQEFRYVGHLDTNQPASCVRLLHFRLFIFIFFHLFLFEKSPS